MGQAIQPIISSPFCGRKPCIASTTFFAMAQYAEVGGLLVEPEVSRWQLRSVRALGVALASCALVLLGFAAGQGAGLPHSQHDGLLQEMQLGRAAEDRIKAHSNPLQQDLEEALTKCALVNQRDSAACRKDATARWVKFVNLGVFKRGDPDRERVKEACDVIERLVPFDEKVKFFGTRLNRDTCSMPGPTLHVRAELATKLHMFGGDNFKDVHEKFPLNVSWDSISAKLESLDMVESAVYCLQEDVWVGPLDEDSFRPMLDYQCEPILLADYDSALFSGRPSELRDKVFEKDWKFKCPGDGAVCLF